MPRLARRKKTDAELSSKTPPSTPSFVIVKSRADGICVAKFAASRENSTRWEKSMFVEWGSLRSRSVRCGR